MLFAARFLPVVFVALSIVNALPQDPAALPNSTIAEPVSTSLPNGTYQVTTVDVDGSTIVSTIVPTTYSLPSLAANGSSPEPTTLASSGRNATSLPLATGTPSAGNTTVTKSVTASSGIPSVGSLSESKKNSAVGNDVSFIWALIVGAIGAMSVAAL